MTACSTHSESLTSGVAVVLLLLMGSRFLRSGKFMPAGLGECRRNGVILTDSLGTLLGVEVAFSWRCSVASAPALALIWVLHLQY
jgi:hypothetical protein